MRAAASTVRCSARAPRSVSFERRSPARRRAPSRCSWPVLPEPEKKPWPTRCMPPPGVEGAFIFVSCPELHTQVRQSPVDSSAAIRSPSDLLAHKLELASGGTLFLDAVHELPTGLQRALVELLENRSRARDDAAPDVQGDCVDHATPDARGAARSALPPVLPAHGRL